MKSSYHNPVLYSEVIKYLLINRDGLYIDGTLGGGGHAEGFLRQLSPSALYLGIDRDEDAIVFARNRLESYPNIIFFRGRFSRISEAVKLSGRERVDAVLLDLGISSHQIDEAERGFSFQSENDLDMRMNRADGMTAGDILAAYTETELKTVFWNFGEEKNSAKIARKIVQNRENQAIATSRQLKMIIDSCVPARFVVKSYARIFQALRIEVNKELEELKIGLTEALKILKPGGRVGVISYHSLEDRIVKTFLFDAENPCKCPPELPVCVCGKQPQMKRIKPHLIRPTDEEITANSRARSAKFRVGEKLI